MQRWSRRRWRGLAAPLLAVPVLALAIHPWGLADIREQWSALEAANLARRLAVLAAASDDPGDRARLHERAEALLAQATAALPERRDVWQLRAANLAESGRAEAALAVLAAAVVAVDDPAHLHRQRVGLLLALDRLDEAEAALRAQIDRSAADADMRHDLVVLLGRRGRWDEAAAAARALQQAVPTDHRGWLGLGVALAAQGHRDDAAEVFREGLRRFTAEPARSQLIANLERVAQPSTVR
jgi:tetratricopeptide (TPR) repeat protein